MKRNTLVYLLLLLPIFTLGNNLQISNVSLNAGLLNFSVSWENSWRVSTTAPNNYDAVWIFVKFRDCAGMQWNHALIDSAGTVAPLRADTVTDRMGIMVYRTSDGVGNISPTNVSVRMTNLPSGNFDFKVLGVEMVYIPEGPFQLGDGLSTATFRRGSITATPYTVISESPITVSSSGSNLSASSSITTGTIPAVYPKGFNDFYIMKYEISQQQYVEFLNCLTSPQAVARRPITAANRYTITGNWPVATATAGNRACNFIGYQDILAYLDWSGFRPYTEMEFEKVCRGPVAAVPGEYVWGTTLITDANTVVNDGTANESVSNAIPPGSGIANYNNSSILGPLRCGFPGSASTSRQTMGSTYYGVCEMSGNLREVIVHNSNSTGRAFVPVHGNGSITATGLVDVIGWPLAAGFGTRGGSFIDAFGILRISDRAGDTEATTTRRSYTGGRGARTKD